MRANAKNEIQAVFSALLNIFEKPSRNTHGNLLLDMEAGRDASLSFGSRRWFAEAE
jgi:hypothetical protein